MFETMRQEGYDFVAAAFEGYNERRHGFTEDGYHERLAEERSRREISYVAQPEIKAVSALVPEHHAQLLNYLKASSNPVGSLVNFGNTKCLEWKRFSRTNISVD